LNSNYEKPDQSKVVFSHPLSKSEIRIEKSPVFAEKIYPEVEWELAKVG
jgi:hypothetical protein